MGDRMNLSKAMQLIRCDVAANPSNPKAQIVLTAFRLTHLFATAKTSNKALWIAGIPIMIVYRIVVEWLLCVELPAKTQVGSGLRLYHGLALVVNDHAQIGCDCTLRHVTTIGCKMLPSGEQGPAPVLGDRVDVGSNVVILGGIRIGNDVVIGAGSVVVHDVPDNVTIVGNPARVLPKKFISS